MSEMHLGSKEYEKWSIFNFLLPKCQTGKWIKNTETCFLNYLVTLVVRNMKAWPICCFLLLGGHNEKWMDQQYTDQQVPYYSTSVFSHVGSLYIWAFPMNWHPKLQPLMLGKSTHITHTPAITTATILYSLNNYLSEHIWSCPDIEFLWLDKNYSHTRIQTSVKQAWQAM